MFPPSNITEKLCSCFCPANAEVQREGKFWHREWHFQHRGLCSSPCSQHCFSVIWNNCLMQNKESFEQGQEPTPSSCDKLMSHIASLSCSRHPREQLTLPCMEAVWNSHPSSVPRSCNKPSEGGWCWIDRRAKTDACPGARGLLT